MLRLSGGVKNIELEETSAFYGWSKDIFPKYILRIKSKYKINSSFNSTWDVQLFICTYIDMIIRFFNCEKSKVHKKG